MDIKKLREDYQKLIGKRPFPGWNEEQLLDRMKNVIDNKKLEDEKGIVTNDEPTPFSADDILNKVYWSVGDGRYRRKVKDLMESKPNKAALVKGLEQLKQFVSEGELKAMIQSYIDSFVDSL